MLDAASHGRSGAHLGQISENVPREMIFRILGRPFEAVGVLVSPPGLVNFEAMDHCRKPEDDLAVFMHPTRTYPEPESEIS